MNLFNPIAPSRILSLAAFIVLAPLAGSSAETAPQPSTNASASAAPAAKPEGTTGTPQVKAASEPSDKPAAAEAKADPKAEVKLEARPETKAPDTALTKPAVAAQSVPAVPARATNAVTLLTLESFQMISDKNIFNQSRVPRVAGRPPPPTNEVRRVPKVDAFALVGTMSYEKGDFAFFDSSNSDYRKTLKAGDKIAGHQVKSILPSHVALEWEGNALDLKVGQQLRREDDGPWQVSNRTEAYAGSGSSGSGSSSGSSSDSGASSATSSSTSASRAETLKRLLEQRAKQKQ